MERLWKRLTSLLSRRGRRYRNIPVSVKFAHFRAIGAANDTFLKQLAGFRERLSRSHASGVNMAVPAVEALSAQIRLMVRSLIEMTGGRYEALLERYEELNQEIKKQIPPVRPDGPRSMIVWPTDPEAFRSQVVGPKAARLAEVASHVGLDVPPFFSVSVYAYRLFMETSGIQDLANRMLKSSALRDTRSMKDFSDAMTKAFADAQIPHVLETELLNAYRRLTASHPDMSGVAVRSSAVVEDAESSFAGQFESILNVRESGLIQAYKLVVASKYRYEALKYADARGVPDEAIGMPVLVMAMVQPSASGVAYSRCPDRPERAMVTAIRGLAQAMDSGRIIPDTFLVTGEAPARVEEYLRGKGAFSLHCAEEEGLVEVDEDMSSGQLPALKEETACLIADTARTLESHFGSPQDVEWAMNKTGSIIVVQTRALHLTSADTAHHPAAREIEGYRILARGTRASGGISSGPVFHLLDLQDIETVPDGAILCIPNTSSRMAGVMGAVRGIIAASGSPTGHMATVAREFGIPCLVGVENALSALPRGKDVTLDADAGIVYEGEIPEHILSRACSGDHPIQFKPAKNGLHQLMDKVAPLTLTETDASNFRISSCQTLHDIARYVHQKSMTEMFELDKLSLQERRATRRLQWRAPMEVLLLDLGRGLAAGADRKVPIEKITSIPLLALIEGMTDPRLRWSGPVGFDLKGFMSVVVRSAADDQRYGEPTYCLCAQDYVHLASRLAYHFATVEAICSQNVNENHARLLFFGGAAVAERREWRAHFLATVLHHNEFVVKQIGDRVDGILSKRSAEKIEEALVMLGRLMIASRHLDMMIESKAAANVLAQAFLSGDFAFERIGSGIGA